MSKNCQMLLSAKNKVLESTSNTLSPVRIIAEPLLVVLDELGDGGIAVWATNSIYAARLEATINLFEMLFQVGKMLDYMMRIHRVQGGVMKWQWIS